MRGLHHFAVWGAIVDRDGLLGRADHKSATGKEQTISQELRERPTGSPWDRSLTCPNHPQGEILIPAPITLINRRLELTEAEIQIADAEVVSGRVMGPRCAYAGTVEVAYYLKPSPQGGMRALIPDPSYWDPQTPFLYETIVRLADGRTIAQRQGLRQIHLSKAGLRINRRPFRVQAAVRRELSDAGALRAAGIDTIVCPVGPETEGLWNEADALGFFLLGMVSNDADSLAIAWEQSRHASCLGWIFTSTDVLDPSALQTRPGQEPILGLLVDRTPETLPPWVQFLAGPAGLSGSGLPWLFVNDGDTTAPLDAFGEVRGEMPQFAIRIE